jgi:non-heme chloroperoxidase
MPSVRVDDIHLEYIEQGDGDDLIFVHGSLYDYRSWNLQIGPFSEEYRVVAYSRRSHYPNHWVEYAPDYSLLTESEDLASVIRALKLDAPVHIVGHSFGAYVAAMMAKDHPELVRTLVLAEPPILSLLANDPSSLGLYGVLEDNINERVLPLYQEGKYDDAVREFVDSVSFQKGTFDRIRPELKEILLQNARTLAEVVAPHTQDFTEDDAKKILAPTLLVGGENSTLVNHRIIEILERNLPVRERVVIKNASHAMQLQNAKDFNESILAFLAKY